MAHNIRNNEDFVFAMEPAWFQFGTRFGRKMTAYEALEAGNGLYGVDKFPTVVGNAKPCHYQNFSDIPVELLAKGGTVLPIDLFYGEKSPESVFWKQHGYNFVAYPSVPMEKTFGTVRTDSGEFLGGVVTNRYRVIENYEIMGFFDPFLDKTDGIIDCCGVLGRGERVFMTAQLPDHITVKGDEITKYLVCMLNHDGKGSAKIFFTPIRVVCQNTLSAALRQTKRGETDQCVSIRHTKNAADRIKEAHKILGLQNEYWKNIGEAFEAMTNTRVSEQQFMKTVGLIYLGEVEIALLAQKGVTAETIADVASTTFSNTLEKMLEYKEAGPGQELFGGTAYNAYNAVTGYFSNVANYNGEKKMDNFFGGQDAGRMQQAFEWFATPQKANAVWAAKAAEGEKLLKAGVAAN